MQYFKEYVSVVHQLLSVWRIIFENYNPNLTHNSRDIYERINDENKKTYGFGEAFTVALSHHYYI